MADDDVNAAMRALADFLPAHAVDGRVPAACVRFGAPARMIVHEARAWSADLLVLGTHGRRGGARLLLGNVAANVLRNAPCSVLVVPAGHVALGAVGSTVAVGGLRIVRDGAAASPTAEVESPSTRHGG